MSRSNPAILVIGEHEPSEALLTTAAAHGEVFVLARAVPNRTSRFLVDEDEAHTSAQARLRRVVDALAARGARPTGLVGDADVSAARRDAAALFPAAGTLLEAA